MSKGKGGGSSNTPSGFTNTTQNTAPWAGQQPFLVGGMPSSYTIPGTNVTNVGPESTIGIMPAAASLYSNYSPQYFPGSTVSPFTQGQSGGLNDLVNFGLGGGSSSVNAANSALTAINSGDLLKQGNPYLGQTVNSITQSVLPAIDSHFAANGRYGSGSNVTSDTSAVANAVAPLQFSDYENQVGNILKGAGISPLVQAGQVQGLQTAVDAGSQQQAQAQAQLNDQINRFNFQQQLPYNKLNTYESEISGTPGGSSSMLTQPFFTQGGGKSSGKSGVGGTIAAVAPYIAKAALAA